MKKRQSATWRVLFYGILVTLVLCLTAGFVQAELLLPESVITIEEEAFYGDTSLREVVIAKGTQVIGTKAFAYSSVSMITLPASVKEIAKDAFEGVSNLVIRGERNSKAESFASEQGFTFLPLQDEGVTAADFDYRIQGTECTITGYHGQSVEVAIPAEIEGHPVTTISGEAFSGNTSIIRVELPDSVITLITGAFSNCTNLQYIRLSESMTLLPNAFAGCTQLGNVVIPKSIKSISGAFSAGSGLKSITLPYAESLAISYNPFGSSAKSLEEVIIEAPIEQLGTQFAENTRLRKITLPQSLKTITAGAFKNCTALETLYIPDTVTSIGSGAIFGCKALVSVHLPASLTEIPGSFFINLPSLQEVDIPDTVTEMGSKVFMNCKALWRVKLPAAVTVINNNTFFGCESLREITVPSGVNTIGSYAFEGCSALTGLDIPASVTSIGDYCFIDCTSLETMSLQEGLQSIGQCAWMNCTALTELHLPDSVTVVGNNVLAGASSLKSVTIGGGIKKVTSVIPSLTSSADTLETLVFNEGVEEIELVSLDAMSALTRVELPESLKTIGSNTFNGAEKLTEIHLPAHLETIGTKAFMGCKSLLAVDVPSSVTTIGDEAFQGCSSLRNLELYEGLQTIGTRAFANCVSLSELYVPSSVQTLGNYFAGGDYQLRTLLLCGVKKVTPQLLNLYTASNPSALETLVLDTGTEEMADSALFNPSDDWNTTESIYFPSLSTVSLPSSLKKIGEATFAHLPSLETLDIPDAVTEIGTAAFYGCTSLRSVNIPAGVTVIEKNTFGKCASLGALSTVRTATGGLTWGEGIEAIKTNAFNGCGVFERVIMPNSVSSLEAGVFSNTQVNQIECPTALTILYDIFVNRQPKVIIFPQESLTVSDDVYPWLRNADKVYCKPNSLLDSLLTQNNVDHEYLESYIGPAVLEIRAVVTHPATLAENQADLAVTISQVRDGDKLAMPLTAPYVYLEHVNEWLSVTFDLTEAHTLYQDTSGHWGAMYGELDQTMGSATIHFTVTYDEELDTQHFFEDKLTLVYGSYSEYATDQRYTVNLYIINKLDLSEKFEALKSVFPQGKYWAHTPGQPFNEYTISDTHCVCTEHHGSYDGIAGHPTMDGSCGCNIFDDQIQCAGFANLITQELFGTRAVIAPFADKTYGAGWTKYTKTELDALGTGLKPGDYVRTHGGHSYVIYQVNDNGEVFCVECNWCSKDSQKCIINWGRKITNPYANDGTHRIDWIVRHESQK